MKAFKLRNILIIPFSLLIIVFSLVIGLQALLNSQNSINNLLKEIMSDTHQMIVAELKHRLTVPEQLNEVNRIYLIHDIANGEITELNNLLLNQIISFQGVDAVFFSSPENWYLGYARSGGKLVKMSSNETTNYNVKFELLDEDLKINSNLDDGTRFLASDTPWYTNAASIAENGWGNLFPYYAFTTLALPNSLKVENADGENLGVIGNSLFLESIGEFLRTLFRTHQGNAFIIDANGKLISSSTLYRPYTIKQDAIHSIDANNSPDLVIQVGMDIFNQQARADLNVTPHLQSVEIDEQPFQLGIFHFRHGKNIDWYLFVYLSEQDILERADENFQKSMATIIIATLITVAIAAYLANYIATPISRLNATVKAWRDNPNAAATLNSNAFRIKEIKQLSASTLEMQRRITRNMTELQEKIDEKQELISQIKKLALVAQSTDDMVLVCDDKQIVEWVNDSFLKRYGFSQNNIEGQNALDIVSRNKKASEELRRRELELRVEGSISLQQVHYDHKGVSHWLSLTIHQIKTDGIVNHHIYIMQDITAQKNYEQELTKWKTVFYDADWGIAITSGSNNNMQLSMANPAFAKLHGYSIEELIGMSMNEFYPEEVYLDIQQRIEVAKETGSVTFETEHINKAQHRFPVLQNISSFRDQGGRIGGLIFSSQDVSEGKSLQSQLMQSQKMEAMGTLAGGMAHDFNNILASIMGNAELGSIYIEQITKEAPNKILIDLKERLDAIIKSCNRASDLTNKILSYSRMESPEFENLHLSNVLKEAVAMVKPMLPATISIQQELAAEFDSIVGNESQLQQVFVNLMTNAFHAIQATHRKNGKVNIAMSNSHNSNGQLIISLCFTDNGCGISKEALPHVFDPFFTTKEKGKGTGLGLAVVSGILRSHKVEVELTSKEDVGTTFTLHFPMSQLIESTGNAPLHSNDTSSQTPPAHIVMVDDEISITEVWGKILRQKNFNVTTFNRPEDAWEYIQAHHQEIDLLLSDFDMEGMTGEELCLKTQQLSPKIAIIMLTGFSEQMDDRRANDIGLQKLLIKPISLKQLTEAVTQALSETH